MQLVFLALMTGIATGFVFAWLKLPIPAPPALPGIMGIIGIFLGYKGFHWLLQWLGSS